MKVVCVHPRFGGLTSHHYNESVGLIAEFERRGIPFRLLMSRHADARLAASIGGLAVIDDPTFKMELSFDERSARFVEILRMHVEPQLAADDCVLDTVATQLEAHALVRWLATLPRERKPWVLICIISDRWNRSGAAERERQVAEFAILRDALAALAPEDAQRVLFFTLTEDLAQELSGLLGFPAYLAEMPLPYAPPGPALPRPDPELPRVGVLGGARREKGSHHVPAVVRACRRRGMDCEFVVQLVNNSLTPEEEDAFCMVADEPGVMVVERPLSQAEYNLVLNSIDLGLYPYEVIPYRQRTSGVFGEAVAIGKPAVVTEGTWMAQQLRAGRAAGTIFATHDPELIADAIARCIADLPALSEKALTCATAWRESEGIPAFVGTVLERIEARRAGGKP